MDFEVDKKYCYKAKSKHTRGNCLSSHTWPNRTKIGLFFMSDFCRTPSLSEEKNFKSAARRQDFTK